VGIQRGGAATDGNFSAGLSTAGSERMLELQARLPGSTFRGGVEPPIVPDMEPGTPEDEKRRGGGVVMTMSPGFVGGKGKRVDQYEKFKARKMKEEEERRRRKEGVDGARVGRELGGDGTPTRWEPPRQIAVEGGAKGRGRGGGKWQPKSNRGVSKVAIPSMSGGGNAKNARNALTMVCLAGAHMAAERERALQALEIASSEGGRMVILLSKGASTLAYRGLYVSNPDGTRARKVEGWGPRVLEAKSGVLREFYRFNTGKKSFMELGNRTFGGTVDAVSLDPTELKKRGGA